MRNNKEYLLTLHPLPAIVPQEGDQATIFDWSKGNSFQVIMVACSIMPWSPSGLGFAQVRAIADNSYGPANFQDSKLRYRDHNANLEEREIVGFTLLSPDPPD